MDISQVPRNESLAVIGKILLVIILLYIIRNLLVHIPPLLQSAFAWSFAAEKT